MKSDSVVGAIPFKKLTLYVPLIIMLTCIVNFIICNKQGTCKPWPHSTITQCSTMYPNNVLARYFFLMPSVVILMIFQVIYGYLNYQTSRLRNPVTVPSFIRQAGYFGFPFFVIAIATMDEGEMADDLHTISAVVFFTVYDLAVWVMFFVFLHIYLKNPTITTPISVGIKGLCCLYQWFYIVNLIIQILQPVNPDQKDSDKVTVELEWGLMFTLLIFLASWYYEFKNVTLSLDENYEFAFSQIEDEQNKLLKQQEELKQKLVNKQNQYNNSLQSQQRQVQQQYEVIDNLN